MVKFEKLTHALLRKLKASGFTILRSISDICDDDPTYIPERIEDVWGYLEDVDIWTGGELKETNLLVIMDAIDNIDERDLRGVVLITVKFRGM